MINYNILKRTYKNVLLLLYSFAINPKVIDKIDFISELNIWRVFLETSSSELLYYLKKQEIHINKKKKVGDKNIRK